jgi:hypothetical protein
MLKVSLRSTSYYESEASLGSAFEADFDLTLDKIADNPTAYQILDKAGYRRCLFNQFPYGVFFKLMDDYIYIIAVAHQKRKPHFWKSRDSA